MQKYRINKTIEQITLIAGNIRTFFVSQGNYEDAYCYSSEGGGVRSTCNVLKKAKIIPDEMMTIDVDGNLTNIKNVFDGYLDIHIGRKIDVSDGDAFTLILDNLPEEACIELGIQDWASISGGGVIAVGVQVESSGLAEDKMVGCEGEYGSGEALGCVNGSTLSLPLPLDKVTAACSPCRNDSSIKGCEFSITYY